MGSGSTGEIGQRAEQLAFEHLISRGLCPVARNFHCRGGEIDLIMLDSDCLVFIEVRYRASTSYTPASHTVDRNKQNKIIRTAAMYVARNGRFRRHTMRFDVVGVQGTHEIAVSWLQDAFRPNNSTL